MRPVLIERAYALNEIRISYLHVAMSEVISREECFKKYHFIPRPSTKWKINKQGYRTRVEKSNEH